MPRRQLTIVTDSHGLLTCTGKAVTTRIALDGASFGGATSMFLDRPVRSDLTDGSVLLGYLTLISEHINGGQVVSVRRSIEVGRPVIRCFCTLEHNLG